MVKSSWLSRLCHKLAGPGLPSHRQRTSRSKPTLATVEWLEQRQLLSAAAVPVGSEALVNTYTAGNQSSPVVAMDSTGDYVVVWQSPGQDGSGWGIFAQRFNAVGAAQGPEFRVSTTTTGDQSAPTVAMDSAGDFVVAWTSSGQDGSGSGIYAQRFIASGAKQGGEFLVNTTTTNDQVTPSVAMDAAGDFVIEWDSKGDMVNPLWGPYYSAYAQRYKASGVTQGAEFRVDNLTTDINYNPSVAMDSVGDFVVTWTTQYIDNFVTPFAVITAKRYDSGGSIVQDQFLVADGGQAILSNSQVAMDPTGDFVVTYEYYPTSIDGTRVYAEVFNSSGASVKFIDTHGESLDFLAQTHPDVAFGGDGNFILAWQSHGGPGAPGGIDGSGYGIYTQQFDSAGNALTSETKVNTFTTGDQVTPGVAMDATGDIIFAWQSRNQDIYSQQFLTAKPTPLLLQMEGTTLSAIGPLNTPLTSALNIHDDQSSTLTGATIKFTSGYQNGQDVLSFTNTAKITGVWNAATGTMTLTGTASGSDYRVALRSITYHNSSATPNTSATRTFSMVFTDGISPSNTATRNLTVRSTSTPPSLTGLSSTQFYVSPAVPLAIAPSLVLTEPDSLPIQSATVSFTNWQAEDRVAFSNTLGLQHTLVQNFTNHTATLTLTGRATATQYQALLRTLTYQDVSGTPNTTAIRNATITVNDQLHNASAMTSITVKRYLTGLNTTVNFRQGATPVALQPNLVATPPAGITTIKSATVSFTNWQAEDRVTFFNTLAFKHTFVQDLNSHTATLTITGPGTIAQFQMLLRTVTYQDVAGAPITTTRTAKFTVNDGTNSVSAVENVTVTKVNQPPVVQINDSKQLTYKVNSASIAIMNLALISDPDSANLSSVTIQISSGYQNGHDLFGFTSMAGITASFNATTGTLKFSGVSSGANYRTLLRSVTFHTVGTGVSTATRVFKVIATDSTNTSSTPVTRSMTVTP